MLITMLIRAIRPTYVRITATLRGSGLFKTVSLVSDFIECSKAIAIKPALSIIAIIGPSR